MGRKSKCRSKVQSKPIQGLQASAHEEKSKSDELILITDRVSLPIFRNDDEFSDEDPELQLDIRPRAYFVSGLCYSCSRSCGDPEFPCEDCHMVSYCTSEHRQRDATSHASLCLILANINRHGGLKLVKSLDAQEYRNLRVELLQGIEATLNHELESREREILLYPRLCCVCRGFEDLERCLDCHVVYFCRGKHGIGHKDLCAQFRVFGRILETERVNGFVAPGLPNFSVEELPLNFDELVKSIFQKDYERIDCASYAALSQFASPVLTVLHIIRNSLRCASLSRRKLLKIHVIGAELQFECANLTLWEKLFLHLLPSLVGLRLEFYGPELQVPATLASDLERPALCSNCRSRNRTFDVVFHSGKLYHQVSSEKPDLVCLFNPGLYRMTGFANQDTWTKTIDKFCNHGVPIILTSYTEVELPRDLERIRELREVEIAEEPRRNPFASLRPERNLVSDDVTPLIYKNYFVAVAIGRGSSTTRCT